METNLELLQCGECGETKHELYIRPNGEIVARCVNCFSQSEITVSKPKIVISNVEGKGTLTVF
jgi:uncharacterized Zn finger protein